MQSKTKLKRVVTSSEDLVLRASLLPAKVQELRDFVLLSSEKLKVYRAKIRAVDKYKGRLKTVTG